MQVFVFSTKNFSAWLRRQPRQVHLWLKDFSVPRCSSGLRRFFLFPAALRGFDDQPFLDGARGHAYVTHFSVHEHLDALEIGEESALGNRRDVRADAAAFLGFTTAPDDAAFHRALAG